MKTSELIGAALDWAVAKCEGCRVEFNHQYTEETKFDGWWQLGPNHWQPLNKYSTDWAQGGPIIEGKEISISREFASGRIEWAAWTPAPIRDDAEAFGYGPTPLIAAMRCYVASKLGDDVTLPPELEQSAQNCLIGGPI